MTDRFGAARQVIADALHHLSFPAAVVDVGDSNRSLWSEGFGSLTFDPASPPCTADTVFDLASLTKVLSTTSLLMRAYEQGVLDIDDPVARHIAAWRGGDREHVTIRDLLSHSSGLPAHREYYLELHGTEAYTSAICAEPLEYRPRTRSVYSDLGFMLLGFILGRERSLIEQFDAWKIGVAPADDLQFLPPALWRRRTAPTEVDWWRSRLLRGEVHDENTFALGGAAGQAGLFGTAAAVASTARHLLQVLDGRRGTFRDSTVRLFATRRSDVPGSRALGWDTMLPTSSCGTRMSARAFGHTGFTGTSLWIDPDRAVYVVLLTNRVHPTRSNGAIQNVRRAFHDAVMHGLNSHHSPSGGSWDGPSGPSTSEARDV
jgi:CubicO group peptidase (beta-lactamase class C family)